MTSSIHSVQEAHSQSQTEQTVQPPKTLQTEAVTQRHCHDQPGSQAGAYAQHHAGRWRRRERA